MSSKATFFTNRFYQIIKILNFMAQPDGTCVEELCRKLRLTRRSVFRLLNTIEHKLNIPVEIRREGFGGAASYKIDPAFVQELSHISLPAVRVSFNQALLMYLLLNEGVFSKAAKTADDSDTLQERLKSAFKTVKHFNSG